MYAVENQNDNTFDDSHHQFSIFHKSAQLFFSGLISTTTRPNRKLRHTRTDASNYLIHWKNQKMRGLRGEIYQESSFLNLFVVGWPLFFTFCFFHFCWWIHQKKGKIKKWKKMVIQPEINSKMMTWGILQLFNPHMFHLFMMEVESTIGDGEITGNGINRDDGGIGLLEQGGHVLWVCGGADTGNAPKANG